MEEKISTPTGDDETPNRREGDGEGGREVMISAESWWEVSSKFSADAIIDRG